MQPFLHKKNIASAAVSLAIAASSVHAGSADEQACARKASNMRDVPMSAVRIRGQAQWVNGSSVIGLKVDGEPAACWLNRHGKVRKVVFGENAGPGAEQACAGEASQINDVRMSAVRVVWSFRGPKRQAWVRLDVDGKQADCHVNKHGEVTEVAAYRD